MKYVKMLSIAALAALSVLAIIGAGSASASEPKAELEAGQVFPVAIHGHGGTGELTTVPDATGKVRSVHCTSSTSTGEINSATTVKNVQVHFKGCTATGPFGIKLNCTTAGRGAGEITTTILKGTLVYTETNSSKTGVLLEPSAGTEFAKFVCGGIQTLSVTGKVIGELTPVNHLFTKTLTLEFTEKEGRQIPHSYLANVGCAHTTAFLSSTGTAAGFGGENFGPIEAGIYGHQFLTLSKAVKINATSCA